jgi:hypothetical protein
MAYFPFTVRDNAADPPGTRMEGLTPTWVHFKRLDTGVAITPQPTVTEIGQGQYRVSYDPTVEAVGQLDCGAGLANPADRYQDLIFTPDAAQLAYGLLGAIEFTYTVYKPGGVTPLEGCSVSVSSDLAGTIRSRAQVSDALGRTVWRLNAGTAYFWRTCAGYDFTDPDTEVVS